VLRKDPFTVKSYPKWHPARLIPTAYARLCDLVARYNYSRYALRIQKVEDLPVVPDADWTDTAVTPVQMQYLLWRCDLAFQRGVRIEVGSYRGVTTAALGEFIYPCRVVAIDPFIEYGRRRKITKYFRIECPDFRTLPIFGRHPGKQQGDRVENIRMKLLLFLPMRCKITEIPLTISMLGDVYSSRVVLWLLMTPISADLPEHGRQYTR